MAERPGNSSFSEINPGSMLDCVVLCFALSEYIGNNILREVENIGWISKDNLRLRYENNLEFFERSIKLLCSAEIFSESEKNYVKGRHFSKFYVYSGPIYWLIRGNSRLLLEGPANELSKVEELRDYAAIARASKLAGEQLIDPFLLPIWSDFDPRCVADVGCGSAHRIIYLLRKFPAAKAIGIDRSIEAIALARHQADAENLSSRVELFVDDINVTEKIYDGVDVIFCALMAHDLVSTNGASAAVKRLAGIFPNAKDMIIVDTCRVDVSSDNDDSTFIKPFEYVHSILGIALLSVNDWVEAFRISGWKMRKLVKSGLPNTYIFALTRK